MNIDMEKQKLLIVDDMPINIQVLAGAFKSDYQVKVATSGPKALEIAFSETPPDLILLDIMMPEMDGYEVCRQLKGNSRTQDIPIIFVTAKGEVEDETSGLELGAVDYITKPFHLPIVKARVKTHLRLKMKTDLLERFGFIDGLTDIPNRRRFDEAFEVEWLRNVRSETYFSVILMDIDYFKMYNDHYGHAAGDECLKAVAQTLKRSAKRAGDLVARYGGEEFVAILPACPAVNALQLAHLFLKEVEKLNIPHARSQAADHVTLSAGVATTVPCGDPSHSTLLEAADKMLYESKRNGRNQARGTVI